MDATDDYIMIGDDGKLYRVSREQMYARPVGPDDEAARHGPAMQELVSKMQQALTLPVGGGLVLNYVSHVPAQASSDKDDQ